MQYSTPPSSFYQSFQNPSIQLLKIVTWNVWFDEFEQKLRYDEILNICSTQGPDVMCFQEVTTAFLDRLKKWGNLHLYDISDDLSGSTVGDYGVLTLVKKTYQPCFSFISFPSSMGRKLLVTKLLLPSMTQNYPFEENDVQDIYIGNVHLESMEYHHIREQQLQICQQILSQFPYYFLCGDFNFCSYRNRPFAYTNTDNGPMICPSPKTAELHNKTLYKIFPAINDLWQCLRPSELGYTFDGSINELISNKTECMRYDRICFHFNPSLGNCGSSSGDEMIVENEIEPFSPNENYRPMMNTSMFPASSSYDDVMNLNCSGKTSNATSFFSSTKTNNNNNLNIMTNNNNNNSSKLFIIEPKAVCILGNEPIIVNRRPSDPPVMIPTSIFVSPPPMDRPYKSVYNRKVINVYPSDHFGLCGTFQFQF
jgi:endonuclease/exonuclease/phosphatase family metal-dependent hydrolase